MRKQSKGTGPDWKEHWAGDIPAATLPQLTQTQPKCALRIPWLAPKPIILTQSGLTVTENDLLISMILDVEFRILFLKFRVLKILESEKEWKTSFPAPD